MTTISSMMLAYMNKVNVTIYVLAYMLLDQKQQQHAFYSILQQLKSYIVPIKNFKVIYWKMEDGDLNIDL